MQPAVVLGNATATVRHAALDGRKLLVLQPVLANGEADGCPILAVDELGAGRGDYVFYTSDGKSLRAMIGRDDCPVRFAVQGIQDPGLITA